MATKLEWASVTPYGADDQRTDFTPNRVAIDTGTVIQERLRPSDSEHAEGKAVDASWITAAACQQEASRRVQGTRSFCPELTQAHGGQKKGRKRSQLGALRKS